MAAQRKKISKKMHEGFANSKIFLPLHPLNARTKKLKFISKNGN